jgi:hypothetical protein
VTDKTATNMRLRISEFSFNIKPPLIPKMERIPAINIENNLNRHKQPEDYFNAIKTIAGNMKRLKCVKEFLIL